MPGGRAKRARSPSNDAHLVQLVRGALGEGNRGKAFPRINVSSCEFVVTLHGVVPDPGVRSGIEGVVRAVPGVQGVINKLRVVENGRVDGVSPG
ncbi:MAG: BON domain-containing protein [Rubrobacteraceae bacterium]